MTFSIFKRSSLNSLFFFEILQKLEHSEKSNHYFGELAFLTQKVQF